MKSKMHKIDVAKALYVPLSSLQRAAEFLDTKTTPLHSNCKRNIAVMQQIRSCQLNEIRDTNVKTWYCMSIRNAIHSHRWDDLAYLLQKMPVWEQAKQHSLNFYMKALIILLMNHPSAKEQSLLQEYAHMVLGSRSAQNKQAIYKSLLSLTRRLYCKNIRGR